MTEWISEMPIYLCLVFRQFHPFRIINPPWGLQITKVKPKDTYVWKRKLVMGNIIQYWTQNYNKTGELFLVMYSNYCREQSRDIFKDKNKSTTYYLYNVFLFWLLGWVHFRLGNVYFNEGCRNHGYLIEKTRSVITAPDSSLTQLTPDVKAFAS